MILIFFCIVHILAFCQDYDKRCGFFKRVGLCESPEQREHMAIYCGVTCEMCKQKPVAV